MSGTVNKVILIGHVGKDPEIRITENKIPLATFSLATSERFQDKKNGEIKTITQWHNVVCWRGLAEIAKEYVKKGAKIYVEGKIRNRSFIDKEQKVHYTVDIIAEEITLLSPRNLQPSEQENSSYPPSIENQETKPILDMHQDIDDLPF